jgi:hypothetical protein
VQFTLNIKDNWSGSPVVFSSYFLLSEYHIQIMPHLQLSLSIIITTAELKHIIIFMGFVHMREIDEPHTKTSIVLANRLAAANISNQIVCRVCFFHG